MQDADGKVGLEGEGACGRRVRSHVDSSLAFAALSTVDHLIAAQMSVDEIAAEIGADSLSFISVDGLYRAIADAKRQPDAPQICDACFTGEYPIQLAAGLSANKVSHGSSR